MAFVEVSRAAKNQGIRSQQVHSVRLKGTVPKWMEKRGKKWFVDETDIGFLLYLKSKVKKSVQVTRGVVRARRKATIVNGATEVLSSPETQRLQELSIQADLSQPIVKLRLETYKIEGQKLKLQQQAGDLISRALAEFLYMGYLDRMNRELLQYQNKIEEKTTQIISNFKVREKSGEETDAKITAQNITKIMCAETEEIIRNIKEAQISELKKWADENGVTL
jgi:hypothetical protein